MPDNETRVVYKAIGDFTALSRSVANARKNVAALRKEQAQLNAETVAGSAAQAAASKAAKKATEAETAANKENAASLQPIYDAVARTAAAKRQKAEAAKLEAAADSAAARASQSLTDSIKKTAAATDKARQSNERLGTSQRKARNEISQTSSTARNAANSLEKLNTGFRKVGNWRPKLTPPFVALIPIVGGVLALINPLVAGLGAVSAAGFGFGASLSSIAGSAIGALPALGALLSVVGALKVAFGGVGNVFKTYAAAQKAGGGGGGGGGSAPKPEEITRTERIARANEAYRRSIQDVQFASEDLDDTRKDYIKRLKELQKAVDRAAQSEARAAANSQLANENYANTLADPGSTKGQKMDAAAGVDEAASDLADVRSENKQAAEDLAEMKAKGVEGDRDVIAAQRRLTDALDAQRDAQLALANSYRDTDSAAGGGAAAANAYNDALSKLSPSARAFVLALIAMKGEWDALQQTVQESFFSEVIGDVERLRLLFPVLTTLLSGVASAAGNVAAQFIRMVTSPQWLEDLGTFAKFAEPFVQNVGEGLLFIIDGLKDATIAALPFTTALGEGFRKGAENFANLLGAAREDGSLAAYLDKVLGRMRQWWRIIKNVGATLFNYGAATEEFGKFLTDGFEKVTEGWRKASEGAREDGSPFKKFLEDIEPLLSNLNGLLGQFFGWIGKTISDEDNIDLINDLVSVLRDDLGPALSGVLDTMADTGLSTTFVETIADIVSTIDAVLKNGGAEAIKTFFETLQSIADVIKDLANQPGGGQLIVTIAGALGALAAISFVGKFTGLFALFGWLMKLSKTSGITKLLTSLGLLKGLGGVGAVGTAVGPGTGTGGGTAGSGGGGATPPVVYNSRAERMAAEKEAAAQAKADKAAAKKSGIYPTRAERRAAETRQTKTIAKSLNKGVVGGIVASVAGLAAGNAADDIRAANVGTPGDAGSSARVGANALEGAGTGAAIGGTIGSVVPVIGTAAGAGIGAGIGSAVGVLSSPQADIDAFDKSVNESIANLFQVKIPEIWNGFVGWVNDWANPINEWMTTPIDWSVLSDFFTVTVPGWWNTFSTWVGTWADPINEKVNTWLADQGKGISDFFTVTIPGWWTTFTGWVNGWGDPINDKVNTWVKDRGKNLSDFFTVTIPGWWNGFTGWVNGWGNPVNAKVNEFGRGAGQNIYDFFFVTIPGWWSDFKRNVNAWGNPINEKVNGWITSATTKVNNFVGSIGGGGKGKYNGGPILKRAGGGRVPGMRANSDTVPAMLTPGEFVVRKAVVNRIGMDNLTKLNSGIMSYSQMLQNAATAKAKQSGNDTGMGGSPQFFNAGGLVPSLGGSNSSGVAPIKGSDMSAMGNDYSMHIGDVHIHNPTAEPASESLPNTIRSLSYLGRQ